MTDIKPKRVMSEAQKEALAKGRETRMKKIEDRKNDPTTKQVTKVRGKKSKPIAIPQKISLTDPELITTVSFD